MTDEKWSIVVKYGDTIKAVSLERITRIKYFPAGSFFWKKNYYGIFMNALEWIIKDIDPGKIESVFVLNFPFPLESIFVDKKIKYLELNDHHLLHAYSTFFSSWFKDAAVLVVDGAWYEQRVDKEVCYSIWRCDTKEIKNMFFWEVQKKDFKLGIGYLYALHTILLGIWEWAIMWLSSYWNPWIYKDVHLLWKDFLLNDTYTKIFQKYEHNWENLKDLKKTLSEIYSIKNWNNKNLNHSRLRHVAAKIQQTTQEVILDLAQKARQMTWCNNICIAGWVGLNILANTSISESKIFEKIFIQPASDDSWLSLGWIHYLTHLFQQTKNKELYSYWLWPRYSQEEIKMVLNKYKRYLKYTKVKDMYWSISDLLADKKIVWFFQWWSEFWPRSLGFRSILARPDSLSIRNKINKIKHREYWRPLAPVILQEELDNYFLTKISSPFMLLNGKIKIERFSHLIWVSHCDATARYQTVNHENNPFLYRLLGEFHKKTGIPVLINTSLNNHDEPIVETVDDAVKMFLSTEIDYMAVGDFILSKKNVYNRFKFQKRTEYQKYFNRDKRIKQKLKELLLKWEKQDTKSSFYLWKVYFQNKMVKMSLSLVQESVIWNNKNILLNFESKVDEKLRENVIKNIFTNKNSISKLLLLYYNDFINENDIKDIIVRDNNFTL